MRDATTAGTRTVPVVQPQVQYDYELLSYCNIAFCPFSLLEALRVQTFVCVYEK